MTLPCACYHGEKCTRSTVCAVEAVEAERDEALAEVVNLEAELAEARQLLGVYRTQRDYAEARAISDSGDAPHCPTCSCSQSIKEVAQGDQS